MEKLMPNGLLILVGRQMSFGWCRWAKLEIYKRDDPRKAQTSDLKYFGVFKIFGC